MARRTRHDDVRAKLAAGEVREINDLITLNLDIRQFAQDVIERCEGPDLLRAFWKSIESVTVLDPTCGSGAFLFAALGILEPLYATCLDRMEAFVADRERSSGKAEDNPKGFRDVLKKIEAHPNTRYFILKSIILNNLFGVDIMEEAVEICKLRLFLKLAAQVEPDMKADNLGVEPLPDIDFNIRAGNTLVGYATFAEVEASAEGDWIRQQELEQIKPRAADLQQAFDAFRTRQVEGDGSVPIEDKAELRRRLQALENVLNQQLAKTYGVKANSLKAFDLWQASHQPFHWFIEFFGIMQRGGFDVIVGNPPYIQKSKISNYRLFNYKTSPCPDIYAPCIERSLNVMAEGARLGLIVPISFQFSDDFLQARKLVKDGSKNIWVSAYSRNPAALFNAGLGVRNTILLNTKESKGSCNIFSSRLYRWVEEVRPLLFTSIAYEHLPESLQSYGWARLDNPGLTQLFDVLLRGGGRLVSRAPLARSAFRFKSTALYYLSVFAIDPPCFDASGREIVQPQIGQLAIGDERDRNRALATSVGKISLLWWAATGDDFHLTAKGLASLPISLGSLAPEILTRLDDLAGQLLREMPNHIIYTNYAGKRMGNYDLKRLRYLTDEIDRLILEGLGRSDDWENVELAYHRFMKMTRERHGTTRGQMDELESLGDE